MASRRLTLQVCVASALALCGPVTVTAGDRVARDPGWTTWGNSPVRQSHTTTSLLTSARAGGLRLAWTRDLGGVGNAQPLYLRGISTSGSTRDVYGASSPTRR